VRSASYQARLSRRLEGGIVRDIVLQVAMYSLDGVIGETGSEFERSFIEAPGDPEYEQWLVSSIAGAGAHVVGRKTYEEMVVFSSSIEVTPWGPVTVARGTTVDELARLREQGDGYVLVHGGVSFVRSLVELDAVDEYRLIVSPYVAGTGMRLFPEKTHARTLDLVSSTPYPCGLNVVIYRRG
jgi:dihydrofolate reductase